VRLTEEEIARRLAAAARLPKARPDPYPKAILHGDPTPAAVLIPFLQWEGEWHLLFIRRTAPPEDRHGGQVAFPGGRREPTDADATANALREAEEELGIHPQDVRILGELEPTITISNFLVTPVVGALPWPYPLRPAPSEVARVFTIPLAWLADPANHEVRQRSLPGPYPPFDVIYFRPYNGEVLWGASARIMCFLLEALEL